MHPLFVVLFIYIACVILFALVSALLHLFVSPVFWILIILLFLFILWHSY
ncbi:hypothetical protein [Caenibacillus caldisaponilyticus]|jgi:hypothetical protein|nr:hypothetical protein [Caenibacillus caldisaponilyticus]